MRKAITRAWGWWWAMVAIAFYLLFLIGVWIGSDLATVRKINDALHEAFNG
ncbi:hypothetical protein VAC51_00030 [Variovorax phage VAC_51]|nr:hypothetical protein VAC51_00030 [Variovorax phage VAC_51]